MGGILKLYNFRQHPVLNISGDSDLPHSWMQVLDALFAHSSGSIAIETYQGVDIDCFIDNLRSRADFLVQDTRLLMKSEEEILQMVDLGDDAIFGFMTRLQLSDYFPDTTRLPVSKGKRLLLVGPGALLLLPDAETRVYADMPRWEIQMRQRQGLCDSLGLRNRSVGPKPLYKQSYFVDWRVLDRHKKQVFSDCHYYLESVNTQNPHLLAMSVLKDAMAKVVSGPFMLKPFFDPGIWGGHWMQEAFGLSKDVPNYAWGFNCVPEENSLVLGFGEHDIEIPAINIVFFQTEALLGAPVHARFGDEFPIRFDFLDTMGGQNLSFQVHPRTEYIQQNFGIHYTQDESYYIMTAEKDAVVYLGLKEGIDPAAMMEDLEASQRGEKSFDDQRFVQTWPARSHDHFLIPAGTVHCSGANSLVLEISATPYIFTFKMWDWDRVDIDGRPRPINLKHGFRNINWKRTTKWVQRNLVNRVKKIAEGPDWLEEQTGLHETEFIETRRHWFSVPVMHDTGGVEKGSVHVLNLVEGEEAVVESPENRFEPFRVYYAETFVIPAGVGKYQIRPIGKSVDKKIATIRASIRQDACCV